MITEPLDFTQLFADQYFVTPQKKEILFEMRIKESKRNPGRFLISVKDTFGDFKTKCNTSASKVYKRYREFLQQYGKYNTRVIDKINVDSYENWQTPNRS